MKILLLGSVNNHGGQLAPFILEQAQALRDAGCEIEFYGVTGHGIAGYLKEVPKLRQVIRASRPDIVHAHYGLCGLVACLSTLCLRCRRDERSRVVGTTAPCRKTPVVTTVVPRVVTTFHGSDINVPSVLRFSKMAMLLSKWSIFVSQRNVDIAHPKNHFSLIPCGIDLANCELDPQAAEKVSEVLQPDKRYVLFAGALNNAVKGPELALEVMKHIPNAQLVELRGYSRAEVTALMHACDAMLMTSKTEGSPQVIKEAMACGLPIVSVDVGDVAERVSGLEGCYVAKTREVDELVALVNKALSLPAGFRTHGRDRIMELGLTNAQVAQRLMEIYDAL